MKKVLIIIIMSGYLGASLIEDTINALVEDTNNMKLEIKNLKDELKRHKNPNFAIKEKRTDISSNQNLLFHKNSNIKNNNQQTNKIIVFSWAAHIRKYSNIKSKIVSYTSLSSQHDINTTYENDEWYKLPNGSFISKKTAFMVSKYPLVEVYTNEDNVSLRRYPVLKRKYVNDVLHKNTKLKIYPHKVVNTWYLTEDNFYIYHNLIDFKK